MPSMIWWVYVMATSSFFFGLWSMASARKALAAKNSIEDGMKKKGEPKDPDIEVRVATSPYRSAAQVPASDKPAVKSTRHKGPLVKCPMCGIALTIDKPVPWSHDGEKQTVWCTDCAPRFCPVGGRLKLCALEDGTNHLHQSCLTCKASWIMDPLTDGQIVA